MNLNFYRTGKLVLPPDIPHDAIREELLFFQIDWEDPNAEEEDEDAKIRKQPKEKQFEHAVTLLHTNKRKDIKRGLAILNELILEGEEISISDILFYKAFGHYRLNEITTAQHTLNKLLDADPDYNQAKSLLVLMEDSKATTVYVGAAFLTLLVAGMAGYFKLKNYF
eukprot:Phypoly_transcript_24618.p1 GENE.Phypoly_transcript_24618~~Phypoly_transcript_24618.p1  ORF type:complete len:176 (+),score=35.78 Phypoly_transcript_24618:28-528(+)